MIGRGLTYSVDAVERHSWRHVGGFPVVSFPKHRRQLGSQLFFSSGANRQGKVVVLVVAATAAAAHTLN